MNAPSERHAELVGRPVPRVEDARFLTGAGRYVGDIDLPATTERIWRGIHGA